MSTLSQFFSSGLTSVVKSVQRGTVTEPTTSVTISAIDPSKSMLNVTVYNKNPTSSTLGDRNQLGLAQMSTAKISSSTTLTFGWGAYAQSGQCDWEVIEFY